VTIFYTYLCMISSNFKFGR